MVLRQALVANLLTKDIENYGLLKLSAKGKEFLDKPESYMLTEDHNYDESDEQKAPRGGGAGAVDPELFSLLKDLRKKIAKKLNLPPFVIFQDPSLEDMAIYYPTKIEELANMTGVGLGKAQRYGSEFVSLIQTFVKENEIERPQDMIVRSIVNKSSLKVSIIQSIDRKVPLDMIAESKGLDMDELLREIESIVNSGTKINIDYFINEVMDQDHQEEIFSYFREEAETESIQAALTELGEDEYSEEDIRLIRIKFISELGN